MLVLALCSSNAIAEPPLVVQAKRVLTAAGQTIESGTIVCVEGKIKAIGKTGEVAVPEGATTLKCEVVMPGLVDVRTCAGLSGILNVKHDSDQLEHSSPLQPELRASGISHMALFGSRARGDARENSDVDLMIDVELPDLQALIAQLEIDGLYVDPFEGVLEYPTTARPIAGLG